MALFLTYGLLLYFIAFAPLYQPATAQTCASVTFCNAAINPNCPENIVITSLSHLHCISGLTTIRSLSIQNILLIPNLTSVLSSLQHITLDITFENVTASSSIFTSQLVTIGGTLTFKNFNINKLNYNRLTSVRNVKLLNSPTLTEFSAQNLQNISSFEVDNAPVLTKLNSLSDINTLNTLRLKQTGLINMTSFRGLETIYQELSIQSCADLTDITLANITSLGSLTIANQNSLSKIGFHRLTTVNGSVTIGNTTSLATVKFPKLTNIEGTLTLQNNLNLNDMNGFSELFYAQSLQISGPFRHFGGLCSLHSTALPYTLRSTDNHTICIPESLPYILSCPCATTLECPCCQSETGICQDFESVLDIKKHITALFGNDIDHYVPIIVAEVGEADNESLTEEIIGSVHFTVNSLVNVNDTVVIAPINTSLLNNHALQDIASGRVISAMFSVELLSGQTSFASNVNIELYIHYSNWSDIAEREDELGLYYIDSVTGNWTLQTENVTIRPLVNTTKYNVAVTAATDHFTNYAILLPPPPSGSPQDDDDAYSSDDAFPSDGVGDGVGDGATEESDGDGEDGTPGINGDGDGFSSGALIGVVIGCVCFAILLILAVIGSVVIVIFRRNRALRISRNTVVNFDGSESYEQL